MSKDELLSDLPPEITKDLAPNPNGGLIIIGSHTSKTTAQLNHLLKNAPNLAGIKLSVPDILFGTFHLRNSTAAIEEALSAGETVVLFTSRKRDENEAPSQSTLVSKTLIDLVKELTVRPSFILTKGGQTASDIATEGFGVRQNIVLGQIQPGVPVWTMGPETRHPGLTYLVFPGNVGSDDALTRILETLTS